MGLAASQARALLLVARKSDLEYRAQCISQRKMVLAQQTENLATNYSNATSNRFMDFVYYTTDNKCVTEDFNYQSLIGNASYIGEFRVTDAKGNIVVASVDDIPKAKVTVPVYKEVASTDDAGKNTYTQKTTTSYGEYKNALGAENVALYIDGLDKDGNACKIQVQNSNGTAKGDAVNYVYDSASKEYIADDIFSAGETTTDASGNKITPYSMNDQYKEAQLYTAVDSTSVVLVTTSDMQEGKNYVFAGYETKEVEPEVDGNGNYICKDSDGTTRKYTICKDLKNTKYFQNALRNGALYLQQATTTSATADDGSVSEYTAWDTKPWQGIDVINDRLYTEDDPQAETEYEAKALVLSAQDKKLDLELKQIETQHKAIETEEESVKKIIDSNIKNTFKIFAQS